VSGQLYLGERAPRYPLGRRLGGPQYESGHGDEKNPHLSQELTTSCPALSLLATVTGLS